MKRCKDCVYYKEIDPLLPTELRERGFSIPEFGECTNPHFKYAPYLGMIYQGNEIYYNRGKPISEIQPDDVLYQDAEVYSAYLYVGAEFCCKHFKEKEE